MKNRYFTITGRTLRLNSKGSNTTAALAALLAQLTLPAQAATYYWDNNTTTSGFGNAGGTWSSAGSTLWNNDSAGGSAGSPNTLGTSITTTTADALNFGTTANALGAGTITLSGTVNSGAITFGSGNGAVILSTGGTINLNGTVMASAAATTTQTINGDIALQGASRQFGSTGAYKDLLTFNGNISGSATLTVDVGNSGVATLNGVNSFGNLTIGRGQLNVNTVSNSGVNSALGAGSTITFGFGGGQVPKLWYTGTSAGSMNRAINILGQANVAIYSQDAPLTLAGSITNGTGLGSLQLSGDAGGGANFNEISGNISGTNALQVLNSTPTGGTGEPGVWKLSGNNTYTGTTTISGGTLVVSGASAKAAEGHIVPGQAVGLACVGSRFNQNDFTVW